MTNSTTVAGRSRVGLLLGWVCFGLSVYLAPVTRAETKAPSQPLISWQNLPGTDDQLHSSEELSKAELIVVAITCNHCPIAIEYVERINKFCTRPEVVAGRVAVVAISVSRLETDQLPRMKQFAERHEIKFPYLIDASQNVGRLLGATYTPEFFVLNQDRQIVYRGSWDNNVNPAKATEHYLVAAVDSLLQGEKPAVPKTNGRGCLIEYE